MHLPPSPLLPPGLDSAEIVSQMRAAHAADPAGSTAGVDVVTGGVGDMQQVRCSCLGAAPAGPKAPPCMHARPPIPSWLFKRCNGVAPRCPCSWASSKLSK